MDLSKNLILSTDSFIFKKKTTSILKESVKTSATLEKMRTNSRQIVSHNFLLSDYVIKHTPITLGNNAFITVLWYYDNGLQEVVTSIIN